MPTIEIVIPDNNFFVSLAASGQIIVRGRVMDKTKINLVENVSVYGTNGATSITDSLGRYHIAIGPEDSVYFSYSGRETPKYALNTIPDISQFDIAIEKSIPGKYTTLSEVVVVSRSYRQDSVENREQYAKIFNYEKPGIKTTSGGGTAGFDLNELINSFRFKRNKRLRNFQSWLEDLEQERYINYRFNDIYVKRLTGLQKPFLDTFMVWFKPPYELLASLNEWQLGEYVLEMNNKFQRIMPAAAILPKKD